jgi:hypothetical protein
MINNKQQPIKDTRLSRRRKEANRLVLLHLESQVDNANDGWVSLRDLVYHIGVEAKGKKQFTTQALSLVIRDSILSGKVEKSQVEIGNGRESCYRAVVY